MCVCVRLKKKRTHAPRNTVAHERPVFFIGQDGDQISDLTDAHNRRIAAAFYGVRAAALGAYATVFWGFEHAPNHFDDKSRPVPAACDWATAAAGAASAAGSWAGASAHAPSPCHSCHERVLALRLCAGATALMFLGPPLTILADADWEKTREYLALASKVALAPLLPVYWLCRLAAKQCCKRGAAIVTTYCSHTLLLNQQARNYFCKVCESKCKQSFCGLLRLSLATITREAALCCLHRRYRGHTKWKR